jgi:hypothetical protein
LYPSSTKGLLAEAALELGLEYVPSVLETDRETLLARMSQRMMTLERRMVGSIGSTRVHVVENRSHTRLYLLYGAAFPPTGQHLRMRRETLLRGIAGLLPGMGDLKVGDPSFDREVWVRGGDAASAYLTEGARAAIIRLIARVPDVRIADGQIDGTERWSRFHPPGVDEVVSTVGLFVEAAERLAR